MRLPLHEHTLFRLLSHLDNEVLEPLPFQHMVGEGGIQVGHDRVRDVSFEGKGLPAADPKLRHDSFEGVDSRAARYPPEESAS